MTSKSTTDRLTLQERKERRKGMCLAVVAGKSYAAVAAEFNVTEQTVRTACKEFATPKKRGGNGR